MLFRHVLQFHVATKVCETEEAKRIKVLNFSIKIENEDWLACK